MHGFCEVEAKNLRFFRFHFTKTMHNEHIFFSRKMRDDSKYQPTLCEKRFLPRYRTFSMIELTTATFCNKISTILA